LCRSIEALAARKPLIIVINNMHLIDPASLEVLSRLARRHETAQLMMIGTYRTEVVRKAQPGLSHLTRELRAHFQCTELPLDVLDVAAVTDYLEWLGPWRNLVEAASWFHHRSGGNPLFLAHLVQHLTDIGAVVMSNGYRMLDDAVSEREDTIPSTLRGLIEAGLSSLDRTPQTVLETASVVGDSFSAVDIANAADIPVPDVERVLRHAAHHGEFIQCDGSRQARDGTVAGRYRFRHEICRAVVQDQVPVSIRAALKERVEIRGEP